MARYYDDRPIRQRHSFIEVIAYLLIFSIIGITLYVAWPALRTRIADAPSRLDPTARIAYPTRPAYRDPAPEQPAIAPADAIADYNATAEAHYQQAIQQQQAAPVPNVNTTGDTAPVQYVSKPAPERLPAADNVPTAEPIAPAESNDQFGSRPAAPVNIQESHTCLHGQVWTESGCHRPTPTQ